MRKERARRARSVLGLVAVLAMLLALLPAGALGAKPPAEKAPQEVDFFLTILHNNDGESQVINAGAGLEDFGGAARFKTVADNLKWEAIHGPWTQRGAKRGVVMISSGGLWSSPRLRINPAQGL